MQWNIADIPVFAAVVQHGGISSAARELRLPKSSVSRFINRLEQDLNLRLFERNSRQMRLTQEGELFYKHAQLILEQVESADAQMNGLNATPSGDLIVSLPMAFSRLVVSKHLAQFHQRYPDVRVHITVNPKPVDLIGDHIDIAVQVGELPDSEYIAVPLISHQLIWVAHPDIARRYAQVDDLSTLKDAVHICEARYNQTPLPVRYKGSKDSITLDAAIETTDPIMVKDSILQKLGIGLLPSIYCKEEIAEGRLVKVAEEFELLENAKASAVYTSKRMLSARTRVFIEFLKEICAEL